MCGAVSILLMALFLAPGTPPSCAPAVNTQSWQAMLASKESQNY